MKKTFSKISNSILLFSFLIISVSNLLSQSYGNEWINYNQKYFKVKVAKQGIYRIEYTAMLSAAIELQVDLGSINPRKIQMFRNGFEIPIYVAGEQDGVFNNIDFIEFYGTMNDGLLDQDHYNSSIDHMNNEKSLYSDTAVYFLTFMPSTNPQNGLRMTNYSNNQFNNFLPQSYFISRVDTFFKEDYIYGKRFDIAGHITDNPQFLKSEGFCSNYFGIGAPSVFRTTQIKHPFQSSIGPKPTIQLKMVGANDNVFYSIDHRIGFSVGSSTSNMTEIYDTSFNGYDITRANKSFDLNLLGNELSYFKVEAKPLPGIAAQWNVLGSLKLSYPRVFNLNNQSRILFELEPSLELRHINWENYQTGKNRPIIYDLTNKRRIRGQIHNGNQVRFMVEPTSINSVYYVTDSSEIYVFKSKEIMPAISNDPNIGSPFYAFGSTEKINQVKYTMITHPSYVGKYTEDYLNYKNTHTTANLVTTQQLYDNFGYGIPSPIAIRRYIRYLKENGDTLLKHIFIVGRGVQLDIMFKQGYPISMNKVPAIGVPASDNLFATDINGSGMSPAVAIGRLTIDRPVELGIYLKKLIDMENTVSLHWRKEVMHLGGGLDGNQAKDIRNRLAGISNNVLADPFGGKVVSFSKSSSGINEPFLRQRAIDEVNYGKMMVTFLGHASPGVTDLDIGDTMDYNNFGKYPIYYFNGCNVGNPCIGISTNKIGNIGEKFIRAQRKGAINFIGQTSLSELNNVSTQMREFYKLTFNTKYTGDYTVGEALKDMLKNYQVTGSELNNIMGRILFLQGDPSYRFYQPLKPDFAIEAKKIFLFPSNLTAISDSFAVAIVIENNGKASSDSFNIRIDRNYPNNFQFKTYEFRTKGVKFRDTVYCWIKSKDISTAGLNKFDININLEKEPEEFNYNNNNAIYESFIPGNGIHLIYPRRFAIVSRLPPNNEVELVAQALNIFETNYQFEFEIDTSHKFNSPWKKNIKQTNIIGTIKSQKFQLLSTRDSIVYYWRARLASQSSVQGGFWSERSFIHIFDNEEGWSQSHFPQFYPSTQISRMVLDTIKRLFDFSLNADYVYVNSAHVRYPNFGIKKGGQNGRSLNPGTRAPGIIAICFDKNTLDQIQINGIHCPTIGSINPATGLWDFNENIYKYYNFTLSNSENEINFPRWFDSIPDGTYVAICNRDFMDKAYWGPNVMSVFDKLGAKTHRIMSNNPYLSYVMIGKKGEAPGWALEDTGVYITNNEESYVEIEKELFGRNNSGKIKSELIGPYDQFGGLYFHTQSVETNSKDNFSINVRGITRNGKDTLLHGNVKQNAFDLRQINTKKIPYLYLEGNFSDIDLYTPPQLKHWRVTGYGLPEGVLVTDFSPMPWRDSLKQGELFNYSLSFLNKSKLSFNKNLEYRIQIFNIDTKDTVYNQVFNYLDSLKPGQHFVFNTNLKTNNWSGRYAYLVKVNIGTDNLAIIPEESLSNNTAIRYFQVIPDNINPLLDVTFDGRHISNGEIISANPVIKIMSKDENIYNLQTDTAGIKIWLKRPDAQDFEEIDFNTYNVLFNPAENTNNVATAEFKPKNLADGIYTLKVQSRDMNNNLAGTNEYQINFQIINQMTATHFYPYPNPFTSSMRFVFTLTGSEVPDYINIKIMTINGTVVRELNLTDLGDIHIGNNITDIAWDGTDQFGDRLSNGVYLYTVTIKKNGQDITQINDDSASNLLNKDKANNDMFKREIGKIVLLR